MSDEPGWYFPRARSRPLDEDRGRPWPVFASYSAGSRAHARGRGGGPAGRTCSRSAGARREDLPSRRLFYWTMRFFACDSARHFAVCTRALERRSTAACPSSPTGTSSAAGSTFPVRSRTTPQKQNPDAAMGGHDWLEFGRLRGGTMLWTEDWFGDDQALPVVVLLLQAASGRGAEGGVEFGGYVIPRTAGDREDGILQKILTRRRQRRQGHQVLRVRPRVQFPRQLLFRANVEVLPKMAEAHRMIGAGGGAALARHAGARAAGGDPAAAQPPSVGRDGHRRSRTEIQDATNINLNGATVDYMAEVFDLYLACSTRTFR